MKTGREWYEKALTELEMKRRPVHLDATITSLQQKGFVVAFYGSFPQGIAYKVQNSERSIICYDYQLEDVLNGKDSWFGKAK